MLESDEISKKCQIKNINHNYDHHYCHAYNAFYQSDFDEALILLNKEDEKNAVRLLDEVRQELSRIDLRLADCMHILSGYQNVLLGNVENFENLEEPEEASEVPNEEG